MNSVSTIRSGTGSLPVVFLHGYNEANWVWDRLLPYLPDSWTCWLIDLPGFGRSLPLPRQLGIGGPDAMQEVARMVWAELDRLGIRNPWLVGHSLGGYVALAMTHERAADVRGLVLFHSSPFADPEERKGMREKVIRLVNEHGAEPFLATFADGLFREKSEPLEFFRSKLEGTSRDAVVAYAAIMRDRPDRSDTVRRFGGPILMIAGRGDRLVPLSVAQQTADLNPSVVVEVLENSAHAGMLEEPQASAAVLMRHLH